MKDVIRVGMADYKICRPPQKILTLGLGSCLGVVLYDAAAKLCGLAHVLLPDSRSLSNHANRIQFVHTCLTDMYHELLVETANPKNLVAKVAGGAKMFSQDSTNEFLNIGAQNYVAVVRQLAKFRIPIIAEDVGDTFSRTIKFDPETGMLLVKAVGIDQYVI